MPKRYHCEFCHKSFQDTPVARKRHLQGAGHQRNRRLHYDSFATDEASRRPASTGANILYSELSGVEILQQWLDGHPEVVGRREERVQHTGEGGRKVIEKGGGRDESGQGDVDKGKRGVEELSSQQMHLTCTAGPPAAAQFGDTPLYLEPYGGVLPPSLQPASSRIAYPHVLLPDDISGWG